MDNINQEIILIDRLKNYYNNSKTFKLLYDISNNPKISLRVIDWFVTNYSKKNNIVYNIIKNEKSMQFNVYTSYKSQLKSYSKKFFDPFCRRQRINIGFDENSITTTIGQLNFFKWAIDNNILKFIYNNYADIETDMNRCMVIHNKIKKSSIKKRKELSKSSYLGLNINRLNTLIYFD